MGGTKEFYHGHDCTYFPYSGFQVPFSLAIIYAVTMKKKKPLGQRAVQDLRLNEVVSDIGIYLIML
jgi:hypothetical protein